MTSDEAKLSVSSRMRRGACEYIANSLSKLSDDLTSTPLGGKEMGEEGSENLSFLVRVAFWAGRTAVMSVMSS